MCNSKQHFKKFEGHILVSWYLWTMNLHYNRYKIAHLPVQTRAMVSLTDWIPLDNESVKLPVGLG